MNYIDNTGKEDLLSAEDAGKSSEAFDDVKKLNSAVAEEEKRIKNSYYQIGKLYVALHPKYYESDFSALYGSIIASLKKIRTIKQRIRKIKGITVCENCGAEVPNDVAFCGACGSPMPKKEVILDKYHVRCDGCGAVVDKNMRFCTSCGKSFFKAAQLPIQEDEHIHDLILETDNHDICPSCGATVRKNLNYCTACGFDLDSSSRNIYSSSRSNDITYSDSHQKRYVTKTNPSAEINYFD